MKKESTRFHLPNLFSKEILFFLENVADISLEKIIKPNWWYGGNGEITGLSFSYATIHKDHFQLCSNERKNHNLYSCGNGKNFQTSEYEICHSLDV